VRGAGRVLDEDRLGVDLVHARHVVDRVVGHRRDQVPARLAENDRSAWCCGTGSAATGYAAADEAVEVLEAHAGRPLVEGTGLAGGEGGTLWSLPNQAVA
jgi:hypothetical protein